MNESLEQLHRAYQDAFNRHDVDALVGLYEPEAVAVGPNGQSRGRDAIRVRYRSFFAIRPTIELETRSVIVAGPLALLHGRWVLRWVAPDGTPTHSEGRNTEVARAQPDGRWLFVIDDSAAQE